MEFLAKLGDWFNAFTAWIERAVTWLFGSSNERRIKDIGYVRDKQGNAQVLPGTTLDKVNALEPEVEKLSDDELRKTAEMVRARLRQGETLDDLLPEVFARARESSRRFLKMRHYDVQVVGGYILHQGMISEMVTGEGKTLVATLAASLNAMGGHVHVVTVNDYLAQRDMEWMAPIYTGVGLTVGAIQSNMDPRQRQKAYACDITYGTNNEFGFDYLRDNMKWSREMQVQGPLDFAIVDEIDNILIDEARTPLIISGPADDDISKYPRADAIVRQLTRDVDFEVKEKEHTCHLTEEGIRHAEELAGVESFYTAGNMEWPHLLDNALKAHHLYKRDVNYVVERGEVIIVDEFTGRKMEGRQWSDGLHQAAQAKEGLKIKAENQTLATITLQNFFKLYKKLGGMTGTAMTEAAEFWKIYGLDVVAVPTNRFMRRINFPDKIYQNQKGKWKAVVEEIREVHATGRPVLVGTTSIEQSEHISEKLKKYGIQHSVLNAKFHEREAEIVAQAGRRGSVTIATNMAGRGTDIILGGNPEFLAWEELSKNYASRLDVPKSEWDDVTNQIAEREGMKKEGREVAELGGLHVVGTERHDSRRIDLQLRGRAGRQGDPGSSRFYLGMDDKLLRMYGGEMMQKMMATFGIHEDEAMESRMLTRRIEGAQKKQEERHFDMRKHLLEYDEVMDEQRKQIYSFRQRILDGGDCRVQIEEMIEQQLQRMVATFLDENYATDTIAAWCEHRYRLMIRPDQIRGYDRAGLEEYLRGEAESQAEDLLVEQIDTDLPEDVEDEREWNWQSLAKWANASFGLNLNDRELKKIGRENLFHELMPKAKEAVARLDFSGLDGFLQEDYPRRSLCAWLEQQYSLSMQPEDFERLEPDDAIARIQEAVSTLYREKEIGFPVSVGMNRFMGASAGTEKYDRDGLIQWANHRFGADLDPAEWESKSKKDIEQKLYELSQAFYAGHDLIEQLDEQLDRVYVEDQRPSLEALQPLVDWTNQSFDSSLTADDFFRKSRDEARVIADNAFQHKFRPELREAERSLMLEVVDTAWKEHLYYMDHLRSGIGLVGYAQKDPKVEYKKEGRKAFLAVWERIGNQVTGAIFRMDRESPGFVGSLWRITSTEKSDAERAAKEYAEQTGGVEPGQNVDTVEPIKNTGPKIGRNDPCPCKSGKKYKKCCGKNIAS